MDEASNRQETAVRLSPCIRITRPAALLAVVIGLFLPAAVAPAAPTHPPASTEVARPRAPLSRRGAAAAPPRAPRPRRAAPAGGGRGAPRPGRGRPRGRALLRIV